MKLKVGDKAPEFNLRTTDKSELNLGDYRGKNVLVLFFPLAFTGVCTAELCSVRDNMKKFESVNAEVLAISVDSLFTLGKFKESEDLNFKLLSDFNKTVSRSYGALYEDFVLGMKGVSKRSAFVIDTEGTIRYAEVLEDAKQQPDFSKIQDVLDSL